MAFDLSWDHNKVGGLQTHHACGGIVLVALLFLVAVRHGFRPPVIG